MQAEKTRVVIAGGGTSGWLTAYSLAKRLGPLISITLVESDQIGTVGVGEATIPTMTTFHRLMEIDEQEFMRATQATFKLGITFDNWGARGDSYIHSFGVIGQTTWLTEFHSYWMAACADGYTRPLDDFCLELKAARQGKFALQVNKTPLNYAYHLNATAYARYLRGKSESMGVVRTEGKIAGVNLCPQGGEIQSLQMEDGTEIKGDLFIDCTGFSGLLIGKALGVAYEDWGHWLAADSAWAVQTECSEPAVPYTRAIAHGKGWQWRIPLQTRLGNGIVYSSQFCSDDEARDILVNNLTGKPISEPRQLKFRTGCREKMWHKNCVAIGLASGFLEPLESTSIHLVTTALIRLMRLFPFTADYQQLAQRYNTESRFEMEEVRDFIIMHYHLTRRDDTDFWNHYRTMEIPENLSHRLEMFKKNGYVWPDRVNLFRVDSWLQVMMGQGLWPEQPHAAGRILSTEALLNQLEQLRNLIDQRLKALPAHHEFLRQYCPSSAPV